MEGKTQLAAAAAAGMSLRTAREWDNGPAPSATKLGRDWRTRLDPFVEVWSTEIKPLLQRDTKGVLEAKFVLALLLAKFPHRFQPGHVRTLQRRFRDWRALHGPEPEVYFPQVAVPGREAAIHSTHATDLGVTIADVPFPHLLFAFVLSYSGWQPNGNEIEKYKYETIGANPPQRRYHSAQANACYHYAQKEIPKAAERIFPGWAFADIGEIG